jgi:hypothetical protein
VTPGAFPRIAKPLAGSPLLPARSHAGQARFQSGALILHSRVERSLNGIREAAARGKAMRESAAATGAAVPASRAVAANCTVVADASQIAAAELNKRYRY